MKRILLTSLAALLVASAANAAAKPYVAVKAGYVNQTAKAEGEEKTKAVGGFVGAIAGGASFAIDSKIALRGELELGYSSVDGGEDELKLADKTILVNGYLDVGDSSWAVKPYVGLSVGYVLGDADGVDSNGITYGAGIGASYAVNDKLSVDLGARYLLANRTTETPYGDFDSDTTTLSVVLGARYAF